MNNKFKLDCLMVYIESRNTDTVGVYKVWYKRKVGYKPIVGDNANCITIRATTKHKAINIVERIYGDGTMVVWIP